MGAAAAELASPPQPSSRLRRQRSVASAIASRCCSVLCCYESDYFFTQLAPSTFSSSRDVPASVINFPSQQQRQPQTQSVHWHDDWRILGSRRARIAEADAVLVSDGLYSKPGRWRVFFRRLRAETRRLNCSRPSPPGFHYDALSYAMNFDDGACWQQQSFYRSPSPELLPSSKLTVSSVS